jgi:hypothetical protein
LGSRSSARGVAADITPTATPAVRDGHVAGWVGVGGYGVGPGGTDEWIQIGVIAVPNKTPAIYYEVSRPGKQPVRTIVRERVAIGERHRFAVVELSSRVNWWRALLDGRPVGDAVFLAGSHARFHAQMMGESYTGLSDGTCNAYAFSFQHLSLSTKREGLWSVPRHLTLFQDLNYLLDRKSRTSFVARSAAAGP